MHSFGSVGYITTRLARTIIGAIEFINSSYSFLDSCPRIENMKNRGINFL